MAIRKQRQTACKPGLEGRNSDIFVGSAAVGEAKKRRPEREERNGRQRERREWAAEAPRFPK